MPLLKNKNSNVKP